jgi:hypothetical protein
MRDQKHERVTDYRNDVEGEKRAAMSPKIDNYAAGVRVEGAEQSFERVVKTDHEHARAERLQKFRHEPHPEFFVGADDEDGEQQNREIAFQAEKLCKRFPSGHASSFVGIARFIQAAV